MRPACLDDPDVRCLWDDTEQACPCEHDDVPAGRPIDDVPTGDLL
jgi:hypothetical protein